MQSKPFAHPASGLYGVTTIFAAGDRYSLPPHKGDLLATVSGGALSMLRTDGTNVALAAGDTMTLTANQAAQFEAAGAATLTILYAEAQP